MNTNFLTVLRKIRQILCLENVVMLQCESLLSQMAWFSGIRFFTLNDDSLRQ